MGRQTAAYHGAGYVGLTGAIAFAQAGYDVTVFDPDPDVVAGLLTGTPKSGEFLGYLGEHVQLLLSEMKLRPTLKRSDTHDCAVHVLAMPTEQRGDPQMAFVLETLEYLFDHAKPGALILVESTLMPGTIDQILPMARVCGRTIGQDLFIAVCPRRDWFADKEKNVKSLPRVIGGVTQACTVKAAAAYFFVSDHVLVTDYRTAEFVKSLENALLHVPVMLCYELAAAVPDVDIAEAVRLAGTHWRIPQLYLGFGTGGRCVPLGTKYIKQGAKGGMRIAEAALDVDTAFRAIVADAVRGFVEPPGPVLICGVAYRPGFKDAGLSPGIGVAQTLAEFGYAVHCTDPLWTAEELKELGVVPQDQGVSEYKVVLLATPHQEFVKWPEDASLWRPGQFVLDGAGTWAEYKEEMTQRGVTYRQVGMAGWRKRAAVMMG